MTLLASQIIPAMVVWNDFFPEATLVFRTILIRVNFGVTALLLLKAEIVKNFGFLWGARPNGCL